jgi:methyltransferase (TIGR00027 family)
MKVVRSVAIFGVVLAAIGRLAFKTLVPQSTAEGVAMGKYLLGDSGLLSDGVGKHFFPWKAAFWTSTPGMRKVISPPGGSAHLATRTWFYDEQILSALQPGWQVVICGAGFDTRAYRMHVPRGVRFFELDLAEHPGVQNYKRRQLERNGILSAPNVTFLPIDFKTQSISDVLARGGHDPKQPTVFLLEGVTMYLTRESVAETVAAMKAISAPGSLLLCELFDARLLTEAARDDAALGPYWKFVTMVGEPYSFGVEPAKMASFWTKELGVKIIAHKTPEEQRDEWLDTPGAIVIDDGLLPHGGICHLFSLRLK